MASFKIRIFVLIVSASLVAPLETSATSNPQEYHDKIKKIMKNIAKVTNAGPRGMSVSMTRQQIGESTNLRVGKNVTGDIVGNERKSRGTLNNLPSLGHNNNNPDKNISAPAEHPSNSGTELQGNQSYSVYFKPEENPTQGGGVIDKTDQPSLHDSNRPLVEHNGNTPSDHVTLPQDSHTTTPTEDDYYDHTHHYDQPSSKELDSGVNLEGKVITNGGNGTTRSPLCDVCQCSRNSSIITCLNSNTWVGNSLQLDASLLSPGAQELFVIDYHVVEVEPGTFAASESQLKRLEFRNINSLVLKTHSLMFSPAASRTKEVNVKFEMCRIEKIPEFTLTQQINETHKHLGRESWAKTRYLNLQFDRCRIGTMEKNALAKARLFKLGFTNTEIMQMAKKSVDLYIDRVVKFVGSRLPPLQEEGLCLHAKISVFQNNFFKSLDRRAVVIETTSQVLFENNTFGLIRSEALVGIEPRWKYGATLSFTSNVINEFEPDALKLSSSEYLDQNLLNNSFRTFCNCNISILESLLGTPADGRLSMLIIRSSYCQSQNSGMYESVDTFLKDECATFPVYLVSAVVVSVVLFVVTVTVCVVCTLRVQQVKEEANMLGDCTSQSFSTLTKNYTLRECCDGGPSERLPCEEALGALSGPYSPTGTQFAILPWGVAFPEVKTYQQNITPELERTESIRDSAGDTFRSRGTNLEQRASCPFN